jgi:membrane protein
VLVWVYYSSQIFLLGAEFTKTYAHRHGSRIDQTAPADAATRPPRSGRKRAPPRTTGRHSAALRTDGPQKPSDARRATTASSLRSRGSASQPRGRDDRTSRRRNH